MNDPGGPLVFHGTQEEFRKLLEMIPQIITGRIPDPTGLAEGLMLRISTLVLSLLQKAFIDKARGGTDEAGLSWAKLSKKTVAYGRRHPGLTAARNRAAQQGRSGRPLLTKAQDKEWRRLFAQSMKRFHGDKGHAAALAWFVLKQQGARTIIGEFGDAPHEILRDTSRLLNSLSPGLAGKGDQILRTEPGSVIVGSNVSYARRLHEGDPSRGLPARRLWPEPWQFPPVWRELISSVVRGAVVPMLRQLVRLQAA